MKNNNLEKFQNLTFTFKISMCEKAYTEVRNKTTNVERYCKI